jgi:hypothetical protein
MATVGPVGRDPERQFAVLQEQVRERLAELRPIRPGSEKYTQAADAVIRATTELIDYEERLPLLLDQAPRRLSLLIIRWSGVVSAAVGVALLVAVLAGWLPRWWLPIVVVPFGAAAQLLRMPVPAAGGRHPALRPGSVLIGAGALFIGIGAAARLPFWLAALGLVLVLIGFWQVRGHHAAGSPASIRAQQRW